MSLKEVIHDFCRWFEKKLEFVNQTNDEEIKILISCSLLESLARSFYPYKSHKERVILTLEQFANDETWMRVSIYKMLKDERYHRIQQNALVDNYFNNKLSWVAENVKTVDCSIDPTIFTIADEIKDFDSIGGLRELCEQYKYSSIFYRGYLCGLVCESKILPEFIYDYTCLDRPYYANYKDRGEKSSYNKHLIIPVDFIVDSISVINKRINEVFIKENINPYNQYK
jgi:hypothetical protein